LKGWLAPAKVCWSGAAGILAEQPVFDETFGQLFNEQRDTIGALDDTVEDCGRQPIVTDNTYDKGGCLSLR
jgi:hypothetical protein